MDYSIVVPVFNKAALTRACLRALQKTLDDSRYAGEVIVVDNASSDETPQMLAEFPWVRVLRNERNAGFAAANNQGARAAFGRFLVLLNNDTEPQSGWLDALLATACDENVGAVGARLLYPNGVVQHAGVAINPERYGAAGFTPFHVQVGVPADHASVLRQRDYQIVTAACMLTPRDLYLECGGLDETFWNGYEDVDYCLRLRAMGLRVVYEPKAVVVHHESQSGPQRFRKVSWNVAALGRRWAGKVRFDGNEHLIELGMVSRTVRTARGHAPREQIVVPPVTVLVHGADRSRDTAFLAALRANATKPQAVVFVPEDQAVARARDLMELRGDRYLAFVDARCDLRAGWLDELIRQLQFSPQTGAATYAPELAVGEDVPAFCADARCSIVHLQKFPQHERLNDFPSVDGALADFTIRGIAHRAGTRSAGCVLGTLPPCAGDERFQERYGAPIAEMLAGTTQRFRHALASDARRRPGLVSIIMLSWNAPQFTKLALESIREHTVGEYEVIIVDNGSRAETVEWLKTLQAPVRVIFNSENRGFAGGNNQALAAARGQYVVLLNNDVVVTSGWLERLLDAFDRIPGLGVSAPRSNKIAGDQIVVDASYGDLDQMHAYAALRAERYRDQGYLTDRAIGLCLCIDRRVIDEVGGIDERFAVGNFEDDDFCLRVRAAGYRIYVCDDVFIHHFGSQTFAANNVDWTATMRENWRKFAQKWELPPKREDEGYVPAQAIRRGFDRTRHFVPLTAPQHAARDYDIVFTACVARERDWDAAANFARRYLRAFDRQHNVLFAVGAFGAPDAAMIARRLRRFAQRDAIDFERCADIDVCDADDEATWLASVPQGCQVPIAELEQRSPSALRRLLEPRSA